VICRYRYHAIIRRVVDGDTVRADIDLGLRVWAHNVTLRMVGIDAAETRTGPESQRSKGRQAKRWLSDRLHPGNAVVVETHRDRQGKYGRWLATIWLQDQNLNDEMVAAGHAIRTDDR